MKIEINVQKSADYDVIVVGSGPAGIGAAIAAARNGARTCHTPTTARGRR